MILDRVVARETLQDHDGRSGAELERAVLDDGHRLIVKRSTRATDLAMRLTDDVHGRERLLWASGVLDRLPPGLGHAIVDVRVEGDEIVTVMHDLGDAVVGWHGAIGRADVERVVRLLAAFHATFAGERVDGSCRLVDRVAGLFPQQVRRLGHDSDRLVPAVLRGWERFAEVVPGDVVAAVGAIHDDRWRIVTPLRRPPATLLHGDLTVANLVLEPHRVTLLDWGLATVGPPALEIAWFLATSWSKVDAAKDQILADFARASRDLHDLDATRLALLAAFAGLAWDKALNVTGHPDAAVRAREREDLGWWVRQVRETLDAGLL